MILKRKRQGTKQFTQFSLIGMFNGALDLAVLNFMLWIWQSPNAAGLLGINTAAYTLAVVNSYFWNSRLTFRRQAYFSTKEKINFVLQALVSLLISNGVFMVFTYWLGHYALPLWLVHNVSKGLSMLLSSLSSFFFMKYLVFKAAPIVMKDP